MAVKFPRAPPYDLLLFCNLWIFHSHFNRGLALLSVYIIGIFMSKISLTSHRFPLKWRRFKPATSAMQWFRAGMPKPLSAEDSDSIFSMINVIKELFVIYHRWVFWDRPKFFSSTLSIIQVYLACFRNIQRVPIITL